MRRGARAACTVIYKSLPELLHVAERTLGHEPLIRDAGLLEAALARPRASAFGADAYPDWDTKAALLHSVARNHARWTETSGWRWPRPLLSTVTTAADSR